jgi:pimeloyl-ACP methyl ester carboxylesterase
MTEHTARLDDRLAYARLPGAGPGVVFLPGFRSDMGGTKAVALRDACAERGRAFLRFDYSGHGESAGRFEDGTIGQWAEDALAVLDALTEGPQILVGSSMGGWIAALLALRRPERVAAPGRPGAGARLHRGADVARLLTGAARGGAARRCAPPAVAVR